MEGIPSLPAWAQWILGLFGSWKVGEMVVGIYRARQERAKQKADVVYVGAQIRRLDVENEVAIINEIQEYSQQLRADNTDLRAQLADVKTEQRRMQLDALSVAAEMADIRTREKQCQSDLSGALRRIEILEQG